MWNRDSWLLWLGIASGVVLYLTQVPPPWQWDYQQWLAAVGFLLATLSAKLATSPLKGGPKNNVVDVSKLKLMVLLFLLLPLSMWACGKTLDFRTNPVGATAHYATQVTQAAQGIQDTVISAEKLKMLPTDKTAAVVKITVQIAVKAQELAAALSELDNLGLEEIGRQTLVAKVGLILQTMNELVYQLNLSDYFMDLSPATKTQIHVLLKEIGQLLLTLAREVR